MDSPLRRSNALIRLGTASEPLPRWGTGGRTVLRTLNNNGSTPRRRTVGRTDAELIHACLGGDQTAWGELVDRYGRLVYSIPRRYGLSEADADDVFQEVFIILYRKLSTLRDPDRLSSWLISTAHRECYRVGRQSGRHAGLDRELADLEGPSEERVEAWERQQLVRQALRQLGGRCEELLLALFAGSDPPRYEEIAEKLGMKVGSIGPTRVRCFKKLEKILAELGLEKEVRRDTTSRELPQPMVA